MRPAPAVALASARVVACCAEAAFFKSTSQIASRWTLALPPFGGLHGSTPSSSGGRSCENSSLTSRTSVMKSFPRSCPPSAAAGSRSKATRTAAANSGFKLASSLELLSKAVSEIWARLGMRLSLSISSHRSDNALHCVSPLVVTPKSGSSPPTKQTGIRTYANLESFAIGSLVVQPTFMCSAPNAPSSTSSRKRRSTAAGMTCADIAMWIAHADPKPVP
mmetsp:Transcript_93772/g.252766  ORF Transcript_93772/g.252766 Transcript_93772/m.252766 type:complete len:220 (+) Transcript_93772:107-766(+)